MRGPPQSSGRVPVRPGACPFFRGRSDSFSGTARSPDRTRPDDASAFIAGDGSVVRLGPVRPARQAEPLRSVPRRERGAEIGRRPFPAPREPPPRTATPRRSEAIPSDPTAGPSRRPAPTPSSRVEPTRDAPAISIGSTRSREGRGGIRNAVHRRQSDPASSPRLRARHPDRRAPAATSGQSAPIRSDPAPPDASVTGPESRPISFLSHARPPTPPADPGSGWSDCRWP